MKLRGWFGFVLAAVLLSGIACSSGKPATQPAPTAPPAPAKPLKLGLLIPQTGVFAAPGKYMEEGLALFLSQNNNTLAGRPVTLVTADSQGNPQTALTQARKLVEQDKVDVLIGPLSAAEGTAIAQYLDQQKQPSLFPIVSSDDLTQRTPTKYIVRTGWTSSQTTQVLGDYAYKELGLKKAITISYDFSFGWESIGGMVRTFQEDGGKVTREIWAPLNTSNFAPYLSQIPADTDAVLCSFSGSAAIQFIQQYRQFGLKAPLVCQGNTTDESTLQATGPGAAGSITALHYSAALDTPANQAFVAAYQKQFNHEPSYYSEGVYVGGMMLKAALEATKGDSSPDVLVPAMRNVNLSDTPRGPYKFDDHGNPVQNVYIRKVEDKGGKLVNSVVKTYPGVSQFWTYSPADFLKNPVYSRDYPKCNACGG